MSAEHSLIVRQVGPDDWELRLHRRDTDGTFSEIRGYGGNAHGAFLWLLENVGPNELIEMAFPDNDTWDKVAQILQQDAI